MRTLTRAWLAGLSCLALMAAAPPPGPMPPEANKVLAHDILRDIVAERSVHDVGTKEVAAILVRYLKAGGFSDAEISQVADPKYPHQANVVVRLKGAGKAKPILWMGHMDVVDARPSDWTVPPFELTEKDGYLYGRGTTDMKDAVAGMAAAIIRLKQEGFTPDRDIIVAFTADEEVGLEQNGLWYLLREHKALVDAALAINPDGGSGSYKDAKRIDFSIETSQKTYVTYLLEARNRGGHSSLPRPDNAIYQLATALTKLAAYQFPYKTNATTKLAFKAMAAGETGARQAAMLALSQDGPVDQKAAALLAKDVGLNSILHSTCVATMLAAGHQENALPGSATATVQCRIFPDETPDGVAAELAKAIGDPDVKITQKDMVVSAAESPPTPEILASVGKVVEGMWPGVPVTPVMVAGASDSIFTRNAGIPSYGVGGGWNDVDDDRMHGRDERHEAGDFYASVEFTYRLMKELSAVPTQ